MADAEEARGDRVNISGIEFIKVACGVDEDVALEGLLGERIIADGVMGEIVEDLQGQEVAGRRDVGFPGEDGAVDDFDVVEVAASGGSAGKLGGLQRGEGGGDFDYFEFGTWVNVWVQVADVVEDVEHEGAVAGAEFVDDEVVVGVVGELVICDEVASDGFTVVRAEELGRGVPELAGLVGGFSVEDIFEGSVAVAEEGAEFGFVAYAIEVEGVAWAEDDDLFGEISIIGVVETICGRSLSIYPIYIDLGNWGEQDLL